MGMSFSVKSSKLYTLYFAFDTIFWCSLFIAATCMLHVRLIGLCKAATLLHCVGIHSLFIQSPVGHLSFHFFFPIGKASVKCRFRIFSSIIFWIDFQKQVCCLNGCKCIRCFCRCCKLPPIWSCTILRFHQSCVNDSSMVSSF